MKYEEKAWSPLWLEFSGLPEHVNRKIRGGNGWSILKKIMELDCAANPDPDTVETSIDELSERTGIAPDRVRRAIMALRRLKLVACFLPENDEETALLKIRMPIATPLSREEIKARQPRLFMESPQRFRYLDDWEVSEDPDSASDPALQEIVDLYFNSVGLKMNAFILDELRIIRARFALEKIRRIFRRAQQNDIHSLHWVVKELIREKRKHETEEAKDR
jgi:hypothetical protein